MVQLIDSPKLITLASESAHVSSLRLIKNSSSVAVESAVCAMVTRKYLVPCGPFRGSLWLELKQESVLYMVLPRHHRRSLAFLFVAHRQFVFSYGAFDTHSHAADLGFLF